jgi:lysophospholipase L1-like esterase
MKIISGIIFLFVFTTSPSILWAGERGQAKSTNDGRKTMTATANLQLKLFLPKTIDAVVGDTLEIFYESLTSAAMPLRYNVVAISEKGRSYRLKWLYTPMPSDRSFPLSIRYYDDFGNLVGAADSTVMIREKAVSPDQNVNILCIGASATAGGEWVGELRRRLCSTGGSPEALGLSNLTFIGSCGQAPARFEAYGGWSWSSYLKNVSATPNAWIYVISGMKSDPATQHSVWQTSDRRQWQLETLDAKSNRLKIKPYPNTVKKPDPLPPEGVLTWVSGGNEHEEIRYKGMQPEKGNPFWSVTGDNLSFRNYLKRNKIDGGIDLCLIGLGGNDLFINRKHMSVFHTDTTIIVDAAKKFLDTLHKEFPECKVIISSLPFPDVDGYGENYDCKTPSSNAFALKNAIIDLSAAYQELADRPEYRDFVDYLNLACQYDGRNGGRIKTRPASLRSPVKEPICINALHPSYHGYMMFADAYYRKITSYLSGPDR